jgi:serine palmitoyltransferase
MALSSASSTQSIFKKKSYISASSYLSAVAEADTRARRLDKTPGSTPALSTSSSVSVLSQDSVLEESDEFDGSDGLEHAVEPSEVFTTVHAEFGHCANETYRFTSQHNYDQPLESHFADPPYYILVSVYLVSLHVCMLQSGHSHWVRTDIFIANLYWPHA